MLYLCHALRRTLMVVALMLPLTAQALPHVESSHRAIYDLKLAQAAPFSGLISKAATITAIDGFFTIEQRRGCDGFSDYLKSVITITESTGGQTLLESQFASWESLDGNQYDFEMHEWQDKRMALSYKGQARRQSDGVRVIYRNQPQRNADLPVEVRFPMSHLRDVLVAEEKGEKLLHQLLFDGSSIDPLSNTSTFIGRRKPLADPPSGYKAKDGETYLPLQIAYYPYQGVDVSPAQEITMRVTSQGIDLQFLLKYEDFSIQGIPRKVEILPDQTC